MCIAHKERSEITLLHYIVHKSSKRSRTCDLSMPSFVYKSKIVSYSRRALSSQETNIFPRASRGGNSFSKTRVAFDITLECGDNPLLPSDCKYRRICEIVGQIELQRICRVAAAFPPKA